MILFSYPEEKNREALLSLCPDTPAGESARAYVEALMEEDDEACDIAVCFCYGTFLVRRFFDEYEFTYPLALDADADIETALLSLEEYTKRHELPLIFCDLTDTERALLSRRYPMTRTEEIDVSEEGEPPCLIYRMRVLTPCDILDTPPTVSDGVVTLSPLVESDIPSYGALCRDEEILSVFGADYRESDPDMSDRDFYENTLFELERGIALTLAVRAQERFVGEITLYAFDGRGGAEFSVRILQGYRKNGYAFRALSLLLALAREELHLDFIDGICLRENCASAALMRKRMRLEEQTDTTFRFRADLTEV